MNNKKRTGRSIPVLIIFLVITVLMAILFFPGTNHSVSEGFEYLTGSGTGAYDAQTQTIYDSITYSKSIDVLAMLLVGFGFLMVFTRKHEYTTLTATLLAVSISIPAYMIIKSYAFGQEFVACSIGGLLFAEFAGASLLIAMGAVLGKLTTDQYFVMSVLFVPAYCINEWVLLDSGWFDGFLDTGGSVAIHAFGAFFGLGMIATTRKKFEDKPGVESDKVSNTFCLLGSMFLWLFWPSFTSAVVSGDLAILTAINTVVALCGSTLSTYIFSKWFRGKADVEDIANAALAGGVAIGSACSSVSPGGAMLIGIIAGIVTTTGYNYIAPKVCKLIKGDDTCGVQNLHGYSGIVGGISAIFVTGNAGVQILAIIVTIVIGMVLGRVVGFICGLMGTKETPFDDKDDFVLEESANE